MRIVILVVLGLILAVAGGVAFFPMSIAADMAAKQIPDFKFGEASGSVWDGRLTKVTLGSQRIGDLSVKADLFALVTGRAAGNLGLVREGFAGQAGISYGIGDGSVDLKDLKMSGDMAMVPGMPTTVAQGNGRFTLEMKDVKFSNNICQTASGEVWTDALMKVNYRGWVGPELRGPVTCADGKLQAQASGKAPTGEDVMAAMNIGQHLDMELTATVANAGPAAIEALGQLGFVAEGNTLVLRQAMAAQ